MCVYSTLLEPILNKQSATRRARGDAIPNCTHWSLMPRAALRSTPHGQTKKFPSNFLRLLPTPLRRKAKRRKEIFGLRRRFSLQKLRKVILFPKLLFFRLPAAPRRFVYTERIVSLTFAHTAHTSHGTLTSVRVACSVCVCVPSEASLEFVVFKLVCANVQAKLYVLVPPSQYAHKTLRFADDSQKKRHPERQSPWVPNNVIPNCGGMSLL